MVEPRSMARKVIPNTAPRSFVADLRTALVKYRADAGMNQQEIADHLGVSRSAISNFELGLSTLREDAMVRLYRLLRSPLLVIADRLRNLADLLVCPDFDDQTKLHELTAFAKSLYDTLAGIVDLEKPKKKTT